MKYRSTFLWVSAIGLLLALHADQTAKLDLSIAPIQPEQSALRFIKNQGQWNDRIAYKVRMNGGSLLLEANRLTWFFYDGPPDHHHGLESPDDGSSDQDPHDPKTVNMHVYRVQFEGANPAPSLRAEHQFPEYHNYFLGDDPRHWRGQVPLYGLLTYESLYEGVDLRMYGLGNAIKYDFLLKPGADPSAIQLRYEGADSLYLQDGALHVKTTLRQVVEYPPITYQEVNGRKVAVPCRYVLKGHTLSFEFPDGYNSNLPLVIDPQLDFSTYSGSFSDNWGFSATYDQDGYAYAGGIVYNDEQFNTNLNGYPTFVGAFQRTFQGGKADVVVSRFSPDGQRMVYATYLGGNGHDQPHSLIVNEQNELYILGRTNSSNFPTTNGALDATNNGGYDLFVSRLNANGTALRASTVLGGSGDDGVNGEPGPGLYGDLHYNYGDDARGEILLGQDGSVYVTSPTQSANFPVSNNAFQPTYGGDQDGCVVHLSAGLDQLIWSTYLGGSFPDAAYALQLDSAQNVYVSGGTMSQDFPQVAGGYQGTFQGGITDGFVVQLTADGRSLMHTTFLGTPMRDQAYFVQLDDDGDVYLYGQTEGTWPVVNPPSGPVYANGAAKQYITKLNGTLSEVVYSTTFGNASARPNISPTAFLVDVCENVYASGWGGATINTNVGGSTNGMPTTPDALKGTTDGDDFYLIVLARDAQELLYASYFGADRFGGSYEHLDGGTCRFDRNGVVYHAVCAGCTLGQSPQGFDDFPTTPGAWSNQNNSTNCNMAVFKIAFDFAGVEADFVPRDTLDDPIVDFQGCAPLRVRFDNTSQEIVGSSSTTYFWDFGDGANVSNEKNPVFTFQQAGSYEVMLVITDPQSCNVSDTAYRQIKVYEVPAVEAGLAQALCLGDSVQLQGSATGDDLSYRWSPATGLADPTRPSPMAFPDNTTLYTLTVTNASGCVARDTVSVQVIPAPSIDLASDTLFCEGTPLQLTPTVAGGATISWSPATFLDDPTSLSPTITALDTAITYQLSVSSQNGCQAIDSIQVRPFTVDLLPDTAICLNDSIQLLSTGDAEGYQWSPATGLDDATAASPIASPAGSTTYTLTATARAGCTVSKSLNLNVHPLPSAEAGPTDTLCADEVAQLQASGGQTYRWTPAGSLSSDTIANPLASPLVSTQYLVQVWDSLGCAQVDSVFIEVGDSVALAIRADSLLCEGEPLSLLASGADRYHWTGPNLSLPNVPDPTARPGSDAVYTVRGINKWGCEAEASHEVELIPVPLTEIFDPGLVCLGDTLTLTAFGGDTYVWSTGDTATSIQVVPSFGEQFWARALSDQCAGMPDTVSASVSVNFPDARFAPSRDSGFAPMPVSFLNLSAGAVRYEWYFGTGAAPVEEESPVYTFPRADDYQVRLVAWSQEGCRDTAYWQVRVENIALHVPSAFTPNGDGINDEFLIREIGLQVMQIRIFSRWGIEVFSSREPQFRWDGTYKGSLLPEGVYTYLLLGVGENGTRYQKAGTVTLIK